MTTITASRRRPPLLVAGRSEQAGVRDPSRSSAFIPCRSTAWTTSNALRDPVALCLIDLRQNGEALRIARAVRSQHPQAVVIGIADPDRPAAAADAIRAGVFDVLPRPPSARDLEALLANAREQAALAAAAPRNAVRRAAPYGIVGTSPAMRLVHGSGAARRRGPLRHPDLRRARHRPRDDRARHPRARREPHAPFVKVDCSGPIARRHRAAAVRRRSPSARRTAPERRSLERIGRHSRLFEAAGGILFLENVAGAAGARAGAPRARAARPRSVRRRRAANPLALDIRPIASVDGSIEAALDEGRLRADLYERLSLIRVDVPALRQRREDIPVLATHFLKELCRANGKPIKTLTRPALTLLSALPWRGNAPELRGLLERLILLVPQGLIRLEDVLAHTQLEGSISPTGFDATLRQARAEVRARLHRRRAPASARTDCGCGAGPRNPADESVSQDASAQSDAGKSRGQGVRDVSRSIHASFRSIHFHGAGPGSCIRA